MIFNFKDNTLKYIMKNIGFCTSPVGRCLIIKSVQYLLNSCVISLAHSQLKTRIRSQDNINDALHSLTHGKEFVLPDNLGQHHLHLQLGELLTYAISGSSTERYHFKGRHTSSVFVSLRNELIRIGKGLCLSMDSKDSNYNL